VYQPTLLVTGMDDGYVVDLNREALAKLPGRTRLEVVAGSTRRPYDPNSLLEPVRLATDWFIEYLTPMLRVRDRTTDDLTGRPAGSVSATNALALTTPRNDASATCRHRAPQCPFQAVHISARQRQNAGANRPHVAVPGRLGPT
jgi:hypothetical protein